MNRQDETQICEGLRGYYSQKYLNRELNINFSKIFPHVGSNDTGL